MKKTYKQKIDEILTPEVLIKMQQAEDKRFDKVTKLIEDEGEPFLEKLRDWIDDFLDESYSYGDTN